jgi:hypothetical protein
MTSLKVTALVAALCVGVCGGAAAQGQPPVAAVAGAQPPATVPQAPVTSSQSSAARPLPSSAGHSDLLPDGTLYSKLIRVQPFTVGARPAPVTRPLVLPVLYVSFAGLQAFDGYSTSNGINHGAVESNPLLRAAVDHPAALWAVKGGAAVTSIWAAERLWRHNRRGEAIAVMVAANAVMAVVAANNYVATHPR